jgi:O-antigen biosynthesis protein WbqP
VKRCIDFLLALALLALFAVPWLFIALAIKVTSAGPALFWSNRVGRGNRIFHMPKFRTMRVGMPELPTHLLAEPASHLTPIGALLRRSSLDEIPQLWSILKGDMSFVGPRPALFNQSDLIELRTTSGVSDLVPGLTGWAQINGRDELPIPEKVRFDQEYLRRRSLWFDLKILWRTAFKVAAQDGVAH